MSKTYKNREELAQAIVALELKSKVQQKEIEESFESISESLKPLNIVKNGFRSVFSGENKEDLVNALLGLGSGILSRKLILGKSKGFVGKTIGKAIQWGMAGLVSKNAEKIKEKAGGMIDRIFKKSKPQTNHLPVQAENKKQVFTPVSREKNFPLDTPGTIK
jgi:hypothetical protein